jgi:hypothetical protein
MRVPSVQVPLNAFKYTVVLALIVVTGVVLPSRSISTFTVLSVSLLTRGAFGSGSINTHAPTISARHATAVRTTAGD